MINKNLRYKYPIYRPVVGFAARVYRYEASKIIKFIKAEDRIVEGEENW